MSKKSTLHINSIPPLLYLSLIVCILLNTCSAQLSIQVDGALLSSNVSPRGDYVVTVDNLGNVDLWALYNDITSEKVATIKL